MSRARTIRLFLVDDTPNGIITVEIINWTGRAIIAPRFQLPNLLHRPEMGRTGVYFLTGPANQDSAIPLVYVGESEVVGQRLKDHDAKKDFWDRLCVFTSKDENLTKAHVRYLESRLIQIARVTNQVMLTNETIPILPSLPESDIADMEYFIEQVRLLLPVLGMHFLREPPKSKASIENPAGICKDVTSPIFELKIQKNNLRATAKQLDGDFVVLAGSMARADWIGKGGNSYQGLYQQLVESGLLSAGDQHRVFTADYAFSSPSAAAAVVCGRPDNGRTSWCVENSKMTYHDWEAAQLEAIQIPLST